MNKVEDKRTSEHRLFGELLNELFMSLNVQMASNYSKGDINMFGMGMPEVILILAVGLIVIGPKKLPELAKSLGKGIVEFKRATQEFRDTIDVNDEVSELRDTVDTIKTDIKDQLTDKPKKTTQPKEKDADKITVSERQEANSHGK